MNSPAASQCPRLLGYEPFSQEFNRDPDEILAKAHAEQPVFWYEPLQCYFVTKYDDVERVFRDWKTFSSRALRTLAVPADLRDRLPARLMNTAFINTNDPQHKIDRRIANQGFTRPKLEAMGPNIEAFAQELIDGFKHRGECDIMREFTYPLTLRVIVDILGLPPEDMPRMRHWTECMFSVMSAGPADEEDAPVRPYDEAEVADRYAGLAEAWDYLGGVLEDRRQYPRDDFCSLFANAVDDQGNHLMSDDTSRLHLLELVAAGNDTTANLMGNILLFLDQDESLRERTLTGAVGWEAVVEEVLRRRPTAPHLMRIAAEDVVLSGVQIPKGSVVVVNVTGANNDADHFLEPHTFNLQRDNVKDHLAFGKGVHVCLGAPLARLEARICMEMLHQQLPGLRVAPQELVYLPMMTVQTLDQLQVRWDVA
jgi:cytochrome P450